MAPQKPITHNSSPGAQESGLPGWNLVQHGSLDDPSRWGHLTAALLTCRLLGQTDIGSGRLWTGLSAAAVCPHSSLLGPLPGAWFAQAVGFN